MGLLDPSRSLHETNVGAGGGLRTKPLTSTDQQGEGGPASCPLGWATGPVTAGRRKRSTSSLVMTIDLPPASVVPTGDRVMS